MDEYNAGKRAVYVVVAVLLGLVVGYAFFQLTGPPF